jgi:preprotein translocase subunit SecB
MRTSKRSRIWFLETKDILWWIIILTEEAERDQDLVVEVHSSLRGWGMLRRAMIPIKFTSACCDGQCSELKLLFPYCKDNIEQTVARLWRFRGQCLSPASASSLLTSC